MLERFLVCGNRLPSLSFLIELSLYRDDFVIPLRCFFFDLINFRKHLMVFFFQINPDGFKLQRFLGKPFNLLAQMDQVILYTVDVALVFELI